MSSSSEEDDSDQFSTVNSDEEEGGSESESESSESSTDSSDDSKEEEEEDGDYEISDEDAVLSDSKDSRNDKMANVKPAAIPPTNKEAPAAAAAPSSKGANGHASKKQKKTDPVSSSSDEERLLKEQDAGMDEEHDYEMESYDSDAIESDRDDDPGAEKITMSPEPRENIPAYFQRPLFSYQSSVLDRISKAPNARGIVAMEMGLGKTAVHLAYITNRLSRYFKEHGTFDGCQHLVIVPKSVVMHWEKDFKKFVSPESRIKLVVMTDNIGPHNVSEVVSGRAHIVITTPYRVLDDFRGICKASGFSQWSLSNYAYKSSDDHYRCHRNYTEWLKSASPALKNNFDINLTVDGHDAAMTDKRRDVKNDHIYWVYAIKWSSLAVDEAHQLRNCGTINWRATFNIRASSHVLITGTPLHNKLDDLYSYLRLIRVPGLVTSDKWFATGYAAMSHKDQYLDGMCKNHLVWLRKRDVPDQIKVVPKLVFHRGIKFESETEAEYYMAWGSMAGKYAKEASVKSASKTAKRDAQVRVRTAILRCRQVCNAAYNLKESVRISNSFTEKEFPGLRNEKGWAGTHSSKMNAIVEIARDHIKEGTKFIVLSCFVTTVDLIMKRFAEEKIGALQFIGDMSGPARKETVDRFQKDSNIQALVLSLGAGSVGLSLQWASRAIIVDPWWNPQILLQAENRVHRINSVNEVRITYMHMSGTLEEAIMNIAQQRLEMANHFLEANSLAELLAMKRFMAASVRGAGAMAKKGNTWRNSTQAKAAGAGMPRYEALINDAEKLWSSGKNKSSCQECEYEAYVKRFREQSEKRIKEINKRRAEVRQAKNAELASAAAAAGGNPSEAAIKEPLVVTMLGESQIKSIEERAYRYVRNGIPLASLLGDAPRLGDEDKKIKQIEAEAMAMDKPAQMTSDVATATATTPSIPVTGGGTTDVEMKDAPTSSADAVPTALPKQQPPQQQPRFEVLYPPPPPSPPRPPLQQPTQAAPVIPAIVIVPSPVPKPAAVAAAASSGVRLIDLTKGPKAPQQDKNKRKAAEAETKEKEKAKKSDPKKEKEDHTKKHKPEDKKTEENKAPAPSPVPVAKSRPEWTFPVSKAHPITVEDVILEARRILVSEIRPAVRPTDPSNMISHLYACIADIKAGPVFGALCAAFTSAHALEVELRQHGGIMQAQRDIISRSSSMFDEAALCAMKTSAIARSREELNKLHAHRNYLLNLLLQHGPSMPEISNLAEILGLITGPWKTTTDPAMKERRIPAAFLSFLPLLMRNDIRGVTPQNDSAHPHAKVVWGRLLPPERLFHVTNVSKIVRLPIQEGLPFRRVDLDTVHHTAMPLFLLHAYAQLLSAANPAVSGWIYDVHTRDSASNNEVCCGSFISIYYKTLGSLQLSDIAFNGQGYSCGAIKANITMHPDLHTHIVACIKSAFHGQIIPYIKDIPAKNPDLKSIICPTWMYGIVCEELQRLLSEKAFECVTFKAKQPGDLEPSIQNLTWPNWVELVVV